MRIAIDVDGVLADFALGFTAIAQTMFGGPAHTARERPTWDFRNGLNNRQYQAVWAAIKASPTFWQDLRPVASAGELRRLGALCERHDVYFVTDRQGARPKAQTEAWLRRHGIAFPTVIVAETKSEIVRAIHADAFVNDKLDNAMFTVHHTPSTTVYLVDRPHNRLDQVGLGRHFIQVAALLHVLPPNERDRWMLGRRVNRVRTLDEALNRIGT